MKKLDHSIQLTIPLRIDPETLGDDLGYADALHFVLALDLAMADAGFTEDLIIRLATSLSDDLSAEEFADTVERVRLAGKK